MFAELKATLQPSEERELNAAGAGYVLLRAGTAQSVEVNIDDSEWQTLYALEAMHAEKGHSLKRVRVRNPHEVEITVEVVTSNRLIIPHGGSMPGSEQQAVSVESKGTHWATGNAAVADGAQLLAPADKDRVRLLIQSGTNNLWIGPTSSVSAYGFGWYLSAGQQVELITKEAVYGIRAVTKASTVGLLAERYGGSASGLPQTVAPGWVLPAEPARSAKRTYRISGTSSQYVSIIFIQLFNSSGGVLDYENAKASSYFSTAYAADFAMTELDDRWKSEEVAGEHWIQWDCEPLERMEITYYGAHGWDGGATLQVQEDDGTWTDLASLAHGQTVIDMAVPADPPPPPPPEPVTTETWRLYGSSTDWMGINKIELLKDGQPVSASNYSASSEYNENYKAELAFDGVTAGRWTTEDSGGNHWIQWDSEPFSTAVIYWHSYHSYTDGGFLQRKEADGTWANIVPLAAGQELWTETVQTGL